MSSNDSFSQLLVGLPRPAVRLSDRRVVMSAGGFLLASAVFLAVMVTHLIDFGADDLRVTIFNATSDGSWSHALTAGLLVIGSGLASIALVRSHTDRALLAATVAIFVFLSIDEISSLHAQIDSMSWGKLVYTPVLVALAVCLWRVARGGAGWVEIGAGLATLVVSFGIHVFGPHIVHALGWGPQSWAYETKVALKEGSEVAGWLLVVYGLGRLVRSRLRAA